MKNREKENMKNRKYKRTKETIQKPVAKEKKNSRKPSAMTKKRRPPHSDRSARSTIEPRAWKLLR